MSEHADRESLDRLIREIGIARFHGRVASGLIDAGIGAEVMRRFIDGERKGIVRRFLERLGHAHPHP
jgi:hypothetical protein